MNFMFYFCHKIMIMISTLNTEQTSIFILYFSYHFLVQSIPDKGNSVIRNFPVIGNSLTLLFQAS